jgi:hypothetical protein
VEERLSFESIAARDAPRPDPPAQKSYPCRKNLKFMGKNIPLLVTNPFREGGERNWGWVSELRQFATRLLDNGRTTTKQTKTMNNEPKTQSEIETPIRLGFPKYELL